MEPDHGEQHLTNVGVLSHVLRRDLARDAERAERLVTLADPKLIPGQVDEVVRAPLGRQVRRRRPLASDPGGAMPVAKFDGDRHLMHAQ